MSGIVVVVLFLVSLWNLSPTQQLVFRGQLFGILKSCIPNSSIFTQMNILDGSFGRVSIDHDNEYRSFWWGGKNTRVAFVHRFYAPIHSLRCIAVPSMYILPSNIWWCALLPTAFCPCLHNHSNIFGSETIIGIRCNSFEKSLFLNCKNKAMYFFTIMIWVIFENYIPIPIYTSYSAFWSPFSMRNQRNLGKIGENLSSPSFLLPLCSFACWCDITFFSEAGMYYVCRYLVG